MLPEYDLEKFVEAQDATYQRALKEVRSGKKQSHWMWFIFPQIRGLGFSSISQRYSLTSLEEANAYLHHDVLGMRLIEITKALLDLKADDAYDIFGTPDDMKLRSCMTLFAEADRENKIFEQVLYKFFDGYKDQRTLQLLGLN